MNLEIIVKIVKFALDCILELIRAISWPVTVFVLIAVFNKKILEIIDKVVLLIEKGKWPFAQRALLEQAKLKDTVEQKQPLEERDILDKLAQQDLTVEHFQLLSTVLAQARFSTISVPIHQIIGNLNNDAIVRVDFLLSELDRKGFIKYDKTKQSWSVQIQGSKIPFLKEIFKESIETFIK